MQGFLNNRYGFKVIDEKGFSLVEVAIGLIITGLIVGSLLGAYTIFASQNSYKITRGDLSTVQASINQYYYSKGEYPCPASFVATETDVGEYGVSKSCVLSSLKLCSDAGWLADGICKTENTNSAVIIGAVPFVTIDLSFHENLDYWKRRILYAVSFQKTDSSTFFTNNGTIKVFTQDARSASDYDGIPDELTLTVNGIPEPTDFILVSMGENGRGAFSDSGVLTNPCGTTADGYESENCDNDDTFFLDRDPYIEGAGSKSTQAGPLYYDDITRLQNFVPSQTWFPHPVTPDYIMTLSKRVGIGTTDPQKNVDVVGNIRSDGGSKTNSFCDNNFVNCFSPALITGESPSMSCDESLTDNKGNLMPRDQGMVRLAQNRFFCMSPLDVGGATIQGDVLYLDRDKFEQKDCLSASKLISGFGPSGAKIIPLCRTP